MESDGNAYAHILIFTKRNICGKCPSDLTKKVAGRLSITFLPLFREEYPDEWDPTSDKRINIWECAQYLIRALD